MLPLMFFKLGREPAVGYSQIEDHITISSGCSSLVTDEVGDRGAATAPHLPQVGKDAVIFSNVNTWLS